MEQPFNIKDGVDRIIISTNSRGIVARTAGGTFYWSPPMLGTMLAAALTTVVDQIPEEHRCDFANETLAYLRHMIDNGAKYTRIVADENGNITEQE